MLRQTVNQYDTNNSKLKLMRLRHSIVETEENLFFYGGSTSKYHTL